MFNRFLFLGILSLSFFLLSACGSKEDPFVTPLKYPVRFALQKHIELLPFPATKGIPPYRPPYPQSPDETDEAGLFSRIEYVVYHQQSGAMISHREMTNENSIDFGDYIYDELEAGAYLVSLVAHNTQNATLAGDHLTQTTVSDSFHATAEVTVVKGDEDNETVFLLKRMVSLVEFVGTRRAPSGASKFILEAEEQFATTNLKTGETAASRPLTKTYLLSPDAEPGEIPGYAFYTFVPKPMQGDTSRLSGIKLITLDTAGDTLHTIRLSGIPILKNRITRYSGSLYAPDVHSNTLSLEVEDHGHWKDTIHGSF